MDAPRIRSGLALLFVTAIVSAFGVASCSEEEPFEPTVAAADVSEGELDPTFGTPDDDPDADDAEGLESPEEAAVDDADRADLEGVLSPLAGRRVRSPVPGYGVTYPFGVRDSDYAAGYHTGQDHAAPRRRAVVAVRSGRIRWSNDRGGAYGKWIGLDAKNGRTYVYCHLSTRRFKAGKRVRAGQRIGRVGATGNTTGPHLHFEDHPKGPFRYAQVRKPRW